MANQQGKERKPVSNRGEDLKNAVATGVVFGILLPWSIATYVVPRLVEEGVGRVGRGLAGMVGKRKR